MSEGGRSYLINAIDNELVAPVDNVQLTIRVASDTDLPTVPFYLVVDPFNLGFNREYMYCTVVVGDVLTVTRNLEGTVGLVHAAGEIVRFAYDKQHLDDIWDAIESVASNLSVHPYQFDISTAGDPVAGFWQRDNVAAASVTELYFNEVDELGDLSNLTLAEFLKNDVILVGSRTGDGLERYRLTAPASLLVDVWTLPVEHVADSGTDFIDNEQTKFAVLWNRDIELGDLRDVEVAGVADLQVLGYDAGTSAWIPKDNNANKGITTLEYLFDDNQVASPVSGDISPNNATPSAVTILRISNTDASGDSVAFILDNITQGDRMVLALRSDDTNRSDYTVVSSLDMGTYHDVTVTFDAAAGTIADNDPIFLYYFQTVPDLDLTHLRLDTTNDPLTGPLSLGSNQVTSLADAILDDDSAAWGQVKTYADAVANAEAILRMRWTNEWAPGTYQPEDVSRDGEWTMVANKVTTDRPAPQPVGSPQNIYAGTSPTAATLAKQIVSGQRYTVSILIEITAYRVYTVAGNNYSVYSVADPLGTPIVSLLSSFEATQTGWRDIAISGSLLLPGTVFDLLALVQEPDPVPTTFNGNWNYTTPNNAGTPGTGVIIHGNTASDLIQINKTDSDAGDRSADLATLVVGDVIELGANRWSIQLIVDQGTYIDYRVAPAVQHAPDGIQDVIFETTTAVPITIMSDPAYWPTSPFPTTEGIIQIDGGTTTVDTNAYGTDILVQEFTASADWDILAQSGSNAGGGDSGGNAPNGLPVGGTAGQYLEKIDSEDFNSGWFDHKTITDAHHARYTDAEAIAATDPLYLKLAGGTMSGNLNMGGNEILDNSRIRTGIVAANGGTFFIQDDALKTRFRVEANTNGDMFFRKANGTTNTLQYDESALWWRFFSTLSMENNTIRAVADPTSAQDAATKKYVDDTAGLYLPLAGGTLSGALSLAGNDLNGLVNVFPHTASPLVFKDDAGTNRIIVWNAGTNATVFYSENADEAFRINNSFAISALKPISMGTFGIQSMADPVSAQDAATKKYVDDRDVLYLPLAGGLMTGIIDMAGNRIIGTTWQLWDVWKIRVSAVAGLVINDSNDNRLLQLTSSTYQFFKNDDATSALFYNAAGDFWRFGTEMRMDTNKITELGNGVSPQDAVTKAQLDAATGGFDGSHNSLTDVTADNHHTRYEDSEAVSANTGIWLSLGGGTLTGGLNLSGNNLTGVLNVIGEAGQAFTLRPSSGQRTVFRDDAGTRFIMEPRTNGDIDWYNPSVAKISGYDHSATEWYHDIDLNMKGKSLLNVSFVNSQTDGVLILNGDGPASQVWLAIDSTAIMTLDANGIFANRTIQMNANDIVGLDILNTDHIRLSDGLSTDLSVAFANDGNTGHFLVAAGNWQFRSGNTLIMAMRTNRLDIPAVAADTTGSAANMHIVTSDGHVFRSTSARKYKSNIFEDPQLADLQLTPVRFHHDGDDKDYIGFIADDMPTPEAIELSDGEVEGYDLRAVVAILAAKVNRLENA